MNHSQFPSTYGLRLDGSVLSAGLFPADEWAVVGNQTVQVPQEIRFNEGHVLSIIFYCSFMLISAVGNTTVLAVLLRTRRPLSRLNSMLLQLAIADLLVTVTLMPLEAAWSATVSWLGGPLLCPLSSFFRTFGLYQSGFVLICISLDRYLAIKKPLNLRQDEARGRVMITCAWVASFISSLPQAVIFHVESHPDFPWYEQCVDFHSFNTKPQAFAYFVYGMIMMYAFPLAVILFCYISILLKICRKTNGEDSENLRRSSLRYLSKAKERTLKMTITIVMVFCVCWMPYYVNTFWFWINKVLGKDVEIDRRIERSLYIFACTNSSMNPIVYGIFNLKRKSKEGNATCGLTNLNNRNQFSKNTSFMSSRNTILSTTA